MHLVAVFNVNESAFAAFVLVIQKKRIEKTVDEVAVGVLEATLELDAVIFWCIIVAALLVQDRDCHQAIRRRTVWIEAALADHDVVDVFSNQVAAAAAADFRL